MGKSKKKSTELKKIKKDLSKKGIEIINFTRESQAPIVSERIQKQKPFVFYGLDNLYPNDLIRMADNSALHSAILDTKAKMIAGDGIIYEGTEGEKFLEEATAKWGGLNKLIERISVDIAYFNSFYLNVQFNMGKEIDTIKHMDFSFIRSGKMDSRGEVSEYWMSTRWDIATNKRVYTAEEEIYRPKEILGFDPKKMTDKASKRQGQLIVAKKYSPSTLYYSKPTYIGATNQIEIAAKIANFHKNQLDNGMTGNLHLHLRQDLSNEEKRIKLLKDLNEQYAGSNNAGRIFLTWGVGDANEPAVNPINTSDVHNALSDLNTRTNEDIALAHQMPRSIIGLDQNTGLGGLEIANALDMFQTIYVGPQQQLIEDTINEILRFNNINDSIKIERLRPSKLMLDEE
ncbi:MAG: hypothetical protein DRP97_08385, partial [Candidatus Latescibacterota bacterium]